jgi:hypothetical protein
MSKAGHYCSGDFTSDEEQRKRTARPEKKVRTGNKAADVRPGCRCGAASVSGDRRDRPLERGRGGEKTARSGTRASGTRRGTTVGQRAGV